MKYLLMAVIALAVILAIRKVWIIIKRSVKALRLKRIRDERQRVIKISNICGIEDTYGKSNEALRSKVSKLIFNNNSKAITFKDIEEMFIVRGFEVKADKDINKLNGEIFIHFEGEKTDQFYEVFEEVKQIIPAICRLIIKDTNWNSFTGYTSEQDQINETKERC